MCVFVFTLIQVPGRILADESKLYSTITDFVNEPQALYTPASLSSF